MIELLLRVKPAPDRRVRKPDGSLLDPSGETVPRDAYWTRRLADGDAVEIEQPKTAKGK